MNSLWFDQLVEAGVDAAISHTHWSHPEVRISRMAHDLNVFFFPLLFLEDKCHRSDSGQGLTMELYHLTRSYTPIWGQD